MIPLCNSLCHSGTEPGLHGKLDPAPHGENVPVVWLDGEVPVKHQEAVQLEPRKATSLREAGVITFPTGLDFPVCGPPVRVGEVWHLAPGNGSQFERAILFLHSNGFAIKDVEGGEVLSISWSPFSLVQSCRLHTVSADTHTPWLRLFRVSVFAHAWSHVFAVQGADADAERARWVADIARVLRSLTQSLFPTFSLTVDPIPGLRWTSTRLLAGYLLLCDESGVLLLYCELHSHKDHVALFNAYVDESCAVHVITISIKVITGVSEVVGIDCSCFSIDGRHFSARTCQEKMLWLRAISNLKVKLQHHAAAPSSDELKHYRSAIRDSAANIRQFRAGQITLRQPGPDSLGGPALGQADLRENTSCTSVTPPQPPQPSAADSFHAEEMLGDQQGYPDGSANEDESDWVESLPVDVVGAKLPATTAALKEEFVMPKAHGGDNVPSSKTATKLNNDEAFPMGPPCGEAAKLSESVPVPKSIAASAAAVELSDHQVCAELVTATGEVQSI